MGGSIALTVRFSDGEEYRGSCWTNILPSGLFDTDFYFEKKSEAHTRQWLDKILESRKKEPVLEEMYGGWGILAPLSYGLVVVDYKSSGFLSCNGYTSGDSLIPFEHKEKFLALYDAGLLYDFNTFGQKPYRRPVTGQELEEGIASFRKSEEPLYEATIKLWFKDSLCPGETRKNWEACRKWIEERFKLNKKEKREWKEYLDKC